MEIYVSSDSHLGHFNILNFCKRPFSSIEEHDEGIIENHNKIVSPKDTVILLGDFCFSDRFEVVERNFKRMNGNKIFIMGNHDKFPVIKYRELTKSRVLMDLHPSGLAELKFYGEKIVFCHFPMLSWNGMHRHPPRFHFFGHIHSGPLSTSIDNNLTIQPNSYDVGLDNNQYVPITLEQAKTKARELGEITLMKRIARKVVENNEVEDRI